MRSLIFTLGQMRTAIGALLLLACASIIGTVIPQNNTELIQVQYGPFWAHVFAQLSLGGLYSSWWFLSVAGFLLFSVSVCIVFNGPRLWRQGRGQKHEVTLHQIKAQPFHTELSVPSGGVIAFLREHGFKQKRRYQNGTLFWVKGQSSRVGYFLVHGGVLLLSIGALLTGVFGYRLTLHLVEGEAYTYAAHWSGTTFEVKDIPFKISAQKVEVPRYFTGMPKQFTSDLVLEAKEGTQHLEQTLLVNKPITFAGHRVYQADYGDGGSTVKLQARTMSGLKGPFVGKTAHNEALTVLGGHIIPQQLQPATVLDKSLFKEGMNGAAAGAALENVGPSLEVQLESPTKGKQILRLFLNMPWVVGVQEVPLTITDDVQKNMRFVFLGLDPRKPEGWALVGKLLSKLPKKGILNGQEAQEKLFQILKSEGKPFLKDLKEEERLRYALAALSAAQALYVLELDYVPILAEATFKPYAGVIIAKDPGVLWFLLGSVLLIIGISLMLMFPFIRVWLKEEKNGIVLGCYSPKKSVLHTFKREVFKKFDG